MKCNKWMTTLIWIICAAFLALPTMASAYTLSLETTDASGNPKSAFMANEELRVVINIDDPTEVAGVAFTLLYDPNVVIPPTTTTEGVASPVEDVSGSAFPFTFFKDSVTTETHRENTEKDQAEVLTGKLYLSGAAINETTGGPKPAVATTTALFTIKFTVKPGVADDTQSNFQLVQTELMNEAAGYGNDADDDGVYEPGDGDLMDKVPVLVGARAQGEDGFNNFDCTNPPCAFPVLLSDTTNPAFATLTAPFTGGGGPKWDVSGTVAYGGNQTGTIYVGVFSSDTPSFATMVKSVDIAAPGAFTIEDVPEGTGYYLAAFRDSDGGINLAGGDLDSDPAEAQGQIGEAFDVIAHVTGKAVELVDPPEASGEFLYYVNWKTANNWTGANEIGTSTGDFDQDGYSNLQELINQTDPTVQNAAGGDGYTATSDDRVASPHFSGVVATPYSVVFYGDSFTIDGLMADVGDEVGVYDPDGVLCGSYAVTNPGQYFVTVYGDDSSSTEIDEGAIANDQLTFVMWDQSSQKEINISQSMFVPAEVYGSPASPFNPPQWTLNNDQWGLNIAVENAVVIPLQVGWNLISFPVNKVFYIGDSPPGVATLTGAEAVQVNSIGDIFASIDGKYTVVRSFDIEGAHTFDPLKPPFLNDLEYVASGYGYWIKMSEPAELVLQGSRANPTDTLVLNLGWNLIGCWNSDVLHDDTGVPAVDFPAGVPKTQIGSISDIFSSIDGFYSVVRSFDTDGAHTFDPLKPPFLNNLHYVGPGYGYWVKTTESRPFHY